MPLSWLLTRVYLSRISNNTQGQRLPLLISFKQFGTTEHKWSSPLTYNLSYLSIFFPFRNSTALFSTQESRPFRTRVSRPVYRYATPHSPYSYFYSHNLLMSTPQSLILRTSLLWPKSSSLRLLPLLCISQVSSLYLCSNQDGPQLYEHG